MKYLLSLPERIVRSVSALAGGLVREVSEAALPHSLRRTRLYRNLVDVTLRFLIERVGQVEGVYPTGEHLAQDFLIRRAAGNGIEIIGIVAFSASPVWVLAALADLSGVGKAVLAEIAGSLADVGLLPKGERFESMEQILSGLERTSERAAEAVNTPPLDIASLRREWQAIREQAASIPPRDLPRIDDVAGAWSRLRQSAASQHRTVFELSSLMALSAVSRLPQNLVRLSKAAKIATQRTGSLFARGILDHYSKTLDEIQAEGFVAYWGREFRPYLAAAARHFTDPGSESPVASGKRQS